MPGTDYSYKSNQKSMMPNRIQSLVPIKGERVVERQGTEKTKIEAPAFFLILNDGYEGTRLTCRVLAIKVKF